MTSKLHNILQMCPALHGQGGIERGTIEMADYIISHGSGSYVAAHPGPLCNDLIKMGVTYIPLSLHRRTPWHILWNALKLCKIIKDHNINLVHARSRIPCWVGYFACKWTKTPFITSVHNTHKIQNKLKYWYNSGIIKGQRIIAISEHVRRHLIESYNVPSQIIDIAHRGFDTNRFNIADINEQDLQTISQEFNLKKNIPTLILVGRITRWKGQHTLIEALKDLSGIPWQLLIVGGAGRSSTYLDELKLRVNELGFQNRVTFTGTRNDTPQLYALSNIAISTSLEPEGFGRVSIEAQAMRCPVIATNHGGSVETIKDGETGFLYPVGDSKSMTKILRTMLTDQQKNQRNR